MIKRLGILALGMLTTACAAPTQQPASSAALTAAADAAAHRAHEAYVTAINLNNLDHPVR